MNALRTTAALGFVLLMGARPSSFQGCSCEPDAPPVPLPRTDAGFCANDSDCQSDDMCADLRCIAGSCVVVSAVVDRDLDAHSPAPCGDDCDDSNSQVNPGVLEQCDGLDNDCNGMIDDNAAPLADAIMLSDGSSASVVLPWNGGFLVTTGASPIVGRPMDRFGNLGIPMSLMSGPVRLFRAEPNSTGTVLLTAVRNDGEDVILITATPDGAGMATVSSEHRIPIASGIVSKLAVTHNGATWLVAYDTIEAGTTTRNAVTVADGEDPSAPFAIELEPVATAAGEIGVAPFASGFAITNNTNVVHLFDASAAPIGQIPPAIATDRFAEVPLTAMGSELVVAYEAAEMPNYNNTVLQRFVAIGTAPQVISLVGTETEGTSGRMGIVGISDHEAMMWRHSSRGTVSYLIDLDAREPVRLSFYDNTSMIDPEYVSVATVGNSIALLGSQIGQLDARVVFFRRCFH